MTHAEGTWGPPIARAIDRFVSEFKARGLPVIYLIWPYGGYSPWSTSDWTPTYAIVSQVGEHSLDVRTDHITITGAIFGACLNNTIENTVQSYFGKPRMSPLRIDLPMEAINAGGGTLARVARSRPRGVFRSFLLSHRVSNEVSRYTVRTFLNSRLIGTWGHGPNQVELRYFNAF